MKIKNLILNNIPGKIYWKDINGIYLGCNLGFAQSIGLKNQKEIIGKSDKDLFLNTLGEIGVRDLKKIDQLVIENKQVVVSEEININETGRKIYFLTKKIPLKNKDEIIGIMGISIDITEQKNAEEKEKSILHEAAQLQKFIIKNTAASLYWKDVNGHYLGCNLEFANAARFNDPEMIIGKTDRDLLHSILSESDIKKIEETDLNVIKKNKMVILEEMGINKHGNPSCYLTKKIPLKNDHHQVIGVMGTSIDITQQKLAEEREKNALLEASNAKIKAESEEHLRQAVMILTGSIAHDLRTPLAILGGAGGLLNQSIPILMDNHEQVIADKIVEDGKKIDPLRKKYLENIGSKIQETVSDMNKFIDYTLKTLSKVISHDISQDDLMTCSMWHCIHNTIFRYPFIQEQRKLIQWDQKDFEFLGNELTMIRVFYNLLKNSLEQIEKNQGGQIIISTEITPEENRIRFRDTAGGASPEIVQQLFEGYRTTKEKGTGVGLAFCKMALESFGAKIHCESVYGEYIEFTLSFPRLAAN